MVFGTRHVRLHALQSALRRGVEEGREGDRRRAREPGLRGRFGAGLPRINDGSCFPAAHDLEVQDRTAAAPAWPSSSTARRCSRAMPGRARARSAAGSSRTTGWKPSSPCPTSSSTTPASPPTSGSSPTASPRSGKGKVQLINAVELLREDAEEPRQQAERDRRRSTSSRSRRSTGLSRKTSLARSSTTRTSATGGSPWNAPCGSTSRRPRSVSSGSKHGGLRGR